MIKLAGLVEIQALKEYYADEPEQPQKGDSVDNSPIEHMDGDMTKAKLLQMYKQVSALFNMISTHDTMNDWAQDKIHQAAESISMVYNFVQYEKTKTPAIGPGDGYPADGSSDRSN